MIEGAFAYRLVEVAGSHRLHRGWYNTIAHAHKMRQRSEEDDPTGVYEVLIYSLKS